ncbi:MAG: IPT/TIG domain-containing protein [Chloroflexi bacterium]|nr:IPT/TIG domain-containing protein [Chloroflexota bacterium]
MTVLDLADGSANPLPVAATHGTITVAPPPTVTSVSPNSGPGHGGTLVAISGDHFQTGAGATFGGRAATEVAVGSATSLTAHTPSYGRAAGDVNGNGSVTAIDALCILRLVAALPEVANCTRM